MSNQDSLLSLNFLEQTGIRDPAERQLVLDALNKNGEIYTIERLLKLFEEGDQAQILGNSYNLCLQVRRLLERATN